MKEKESELRKAIRIELVHGLTTEILASLPKDPSDKEVIKAIVRKMCEFGHRVLPEDRCCNTCEKVQDWMKSNKDKIIGCKITEVVKNIMLVYVKRLVSQGRKYVKQIHKRCKKEQKELYT